MAELGVGYISILPEVSKISPGIASALKGVEPEADKTGRSMGGRISSGMGTVLKAGVAGVGVAAGATLAGAITKGMGRLTGIENAQASLRGLGHDTKSVSAIMDSALASVKGTAFGLDTAATVAASAVAAGIQPGQELERTLKMTGDAATIAGIEMDAMGSIVNKVATSNKMQMDVANQLMDAGIPILQMVADEMGVTAEEASKMATEGKVSFETFQNALEKGVGGAALEAGNTFQGAASNMGAALGRLGATGLTPFFDLTKDGMGVATRAIDGLESVIAPMADTVAAWLQGKAVPAVKEFAASFQALGQNRDVQGIFQGTQDTVSQLVDTGRALAPVVVNIATAFGQAGAALGVTAWSTFVGTLEIAGSALETVAGPLESVTSFLNDHPALVAAGIVAWAGFKTVPDLLGKVSAATEPLRSSTSNLGKSVSDLQAYYASTGREITKFEALAQVAGTSSNSTISAMGKHLNNASIEGGVFARTTGVLKAGMEGAKGAASGLMGLFGGPWGVALLAAGTAIGAVSQANQKAETSQNNMAAAAKESATAQLELQSAVSGTTGALNEQALAAAAGVAKGELAELVEMGESYSGWLRKVDTDTNIWERMFNIGGEWEADKQAATEIRETYQQLETTLEDVGVSKEDLNAIIAEGGPQFDSLVSKLRESGEAGNRAADELEGAREKIDQMVDDARRLDPAVAEAAAAIDVLADSSSTADEKLGALQRMLQAMGLAPKDAEQALWDASAATDELVKSLEGVERPAGLVGQNLFDMDGALDKNNEQSRALREELIDLAGELQNVATNAEDIGDIDEAWSGMQPGLEALAQSFDLPIEKIMELGHELGLAPDEIRVAMALEGADEAATQLSNVWAQMREIPAGQQVEFSALTEDAIADLEAIGYKVDEIEGSENVLVTAETEHATQTLDAVMQQLVDLDGLDVQTSVLLNTTSLEGSASNAQSILDALDIQEPTPQAGIIIGQLLDGVDISQGQLDFLASQTPTPAADLNRALLEGGVSVSHEMLNALQSRPTTPVLDADGKPLTAAVAAAQGELSKLKDKNVTITTTHKRIDYWVNQGYSADEAAKVQGPFPVLASGGRAPAPNRGYRLPTTGPGTEIVDGFLGLDDNHRPVARVNRGEWVVNGRASDKYDRELAAINAGVFPKLPGYEDGGRAGMTASELLSFADGREVRGQQASRSLQGAIYQFAGINWGDCSSAMAGLARFAVGVAPFASRFATGNQREALRGLGFSPGLGNPSTDFSIGWYNGGPWGGHTSGTIAGTNVEMGGGAGGNGKIGGGAAPASHSQYTDHAHLSLGQPMRSESITQYGGSQTEGYPSLPVASTSTSGVTLKNGTTVNWGEATGFYDQALAYLQRPKVGLFDTGGVLGTGQFAFNAGPPERILPAGLTKSFDQFVVMVPGLVSALQRGDVSGAQSQMTQAADTMMESAKLEAKTQAERAEVEIESARSEVQSAGQNLGGDWVGQATIVRDAEKGLADLRRQLVIETDNIVLAEENLVKAQKNLAEAQSEGAVLSDSASRKIADAEEAVAKAREPDSKGKVSADKIADAEKRLSRAREDADKELAKSEDKNAETVKKAMAEVAKAEETLTETRVINSDAAIRLEAAERAIAASRYQALADMVGGIGAALGAGVGHLGGFFDEMSRLAGIVEQTRQSVSKLQMQQVTNQVNLLKAQHDLQVSEWDLQRTRARGALNLVEAEQNVEDARARAALMGATSIEAMSGALDRFRETGIFSVGEVSESVIENSKEVQAALWGVQIVEAQNALDALNSAHHQSLAQFAVAEATLAQSRAAQMLGLQTAHLEQQTAQLYGLTQNQATGASKGLGGLGGLLGGIGKIGGGILTGLAGFATAGPLGAIPGAIMALGGLGETVKGGIDAWNNRDDVADAWGQMGGLEKVAVVGGGLLGGAAALGGAYLGGPEGAVLGAQLGDAILDTTVGSLQYNMSSLMEKQNRDHADRMAALELSLGRQEANLGEDKLIAELEYLRSKDRLEADLEYSKLMQQAATASSEQMTEKLLEAAAIEAARAGHADAEQLSELQRSGNALGRLVELMAQQLEATRSGNRGISDQADQIVGGLAQALVQSAGGSQWSADAYMNSRL